MKSTTVLFLLAAAIAGADDPDLQDRLRILAEGQVPALAKSGALTATSYTSSNYNASFHCPPGWTITAIDSTPTRVLLNVAKTGRNSVLVYLTRNVTNAEAVFRDAYSAYLAVRTAYGAAQDYPLVLAAFDTSAEAGALHMSYVQLEYTPSGGPTRIYDMISGSTGVYSHFVAYSATESDYDANYEDYDAVGEGLEFLTDVVPVLPPNPLPKGSHGITVRGNMVLNPGGFKIEFLNAQGRRQMASSEKRIQVDNAQKLFLKVRLP
ncbi:MAG: hypothetical protein K0Q91_2240 [Fibrobacteria bacterium]|jgi:hypothetical protein|nr:hypothetical protein [Fibrobacteria bacterium]